MHHRGAFLFLESNFLNLTGTIVQREDMSQTTELTGVGVLEFISSVQNPRLSFQILALQKITYSITPGGFSEGPSVAHSGERRGGVKHAGEGG